MGAMESLRWMEARLPEILKDLEAFVRRESPSGDLEGLEAAARFLEEAFGPLEGRLSRKDTPAGPVLLLKREGEGAPVLLLCHYDTVHPKGSFPEPFRLEREKAIGPGVYDMKGGSSPSSTPCATPRPRGGGFPPSRSSSPPTRRWAPRKAAPSLRPPPRRPGRCWSWNPHRGRPPEGGPQGGRALPA